MAMYFTWQKGPKGPVAAVYHDDPPPKVYNQGVTILATHKLLDDEEKDFRREHIGIATLSVLYPPPRTEE